MEAAGEGRNVTGTTVEEVLRHQTGTKSDLAPNTAALDELRQDY